jgi:3-phenylpropionate/cinnamic acid dioxygenase small subunit
MESDLAELILERNYRQLLGRFAQASDDGRFEDVLALFAEDATYRVGDTLLRGRDEIRKRISAGPVGRRSRTGAFSVAPPGG